MRPRRLMKRGGSAVAWHVTPAHAASYADGSLPETDAWSVEKHVETCTACAERVSVAVRAGAAAPALADVRAALLAFTEADTAPIPAPEPAPAAFGDAGAAANGRRVGAPLGAAARPSAGAAAPEPVAARHDGEAAAAADPGRQVGAPVNGATTAARTPADSPTAEAGGAAARPSAGAAAPGLAATRHDGEAAPPSASAADIDRRGDAALSGHVAARTPADSPAATRRGFRFGRGPRGWTAWAAGPAVRGPWLVALLVTGVLAAGAARAAGVSGVRPLLLALAPVLPSAGVAVSYGRHADPMHELTASTPSGGLRLLLTRTAAVLAVCVPLLTLVGLLLPAAAGAPAASVWLLPGLALTLAALALASYVGCRIATCAVTAGWLLAVGAPALLAGPGQGERGSLADALTDSLTAVLSGPAAQSCWAAAAAVCAGLLALRRTSFDHLERI
ncbi:zf-HC2 domain-containing protein [Streptomyces sp. LZ34]